MTIAANLTSRTGKNAIKALAKNYQNNLASDYTEIIKNLTQDFQYEKDRNHYWSKPQFSLFYGSSLYEQASLAQKLALNHLFWTLFYKTTADSEIEVTHHNLKLHQHLLNEYRHFTAKLDYLWTVNREMRLMAAGGSIAKAIAQNKKAFQQFAKSV